MAKEDCAYYEDCPYRNDMGHCARWCMRYRHKDDVRVVRCKDCGAYNTTNCAEGFGWCGHFDRGMMDNDFCSHGGRRTDE